MISHMPETLDGNAAARQSVISGGGFENGPYAGGDAIRGGKGGITGTSNFFVYARDVRSFPPNHRHVVRIGSDILPGDVPATRRAPHSTS